MSVSDLMQRIAELSLHVQELERTERDQQDKIGKLREAWEKFCDENGVGFNGDDVDRALQELEK